MEDIYEQNMVILKNASNKALSLLSKLKDLKYFDNTNYENNIKDIKFTLVSEDDAKIFNNNQLALYHLDTNSIYVRESMLNSSVLNEDFVCMLLLHELIHMASTNRKKNKNGFSHDALPITYNEGCTQYITLKILYDNMEEAINNNTVYPESTKAIKDAVDSLGEEKMFDGFFSCDVRKHADNLNPKELDRWVDTIMVLTNSLEEKMSKESANLLQEREEEYLR